MISPPDTLEHVCIHADDGTALAGTLYRPNQSTDTGDAVLIASATGVKRGYYHKFARHLADRGCTVLTFDYRGIGGSRPKSLRGFTGQMHQWGEQDISAAISWIDATVTPNRMLLVAHSVGGQVLCLAPNNTRFDRILFIGAQAGHWRNWQGLERLWVLLFWHIFLPILVPVCGKLPGWLLGSEELPASVAWQWRRWGLAREYVKSHGPQAEEGFKRITAPMRFYGFSDDNFAPEKAIRQLKEWYGNAPSDLKIVHPKDVGVKSIGHFGFFKSRFSENLWSGATSWLLTPGSRTSTPRK